MGRFETETLSMSSRSSISGHCLPVLSLLSGWLLLTACCVADGSDPSHWAFEPIRQVVPPKQGLHAADSPIDAFVRAALTQRGMTFSPPAGRRTLIRRATFDLIGLPPTPDEVAEFLADSSPGAFAKVVDRLLALPHYGERWGRHWLDVVRYADTAGETADYPVPEAYRYRDYVIAAFNRDKPYDAFVREQIAGDIIARRGWEEGTISDQRYAELVTATGFLAIARRFGFDTERYEYLTIQDTIDTMGRSMLGLSLGCARCHDHKYDPVTMEDYYGLYGMFASTRYAFAGSERLPATRAMTPLVPPDAAASQWNAWRTRIAELATQVKALEADYKVPGRPTQIRPLNDLDGDFELQTPPSGGSLGFPANPWQYEGDVRIATSAQSPYVEIYPAGSSGAVFAAVEDSVLLSRGFVPPIADERTSTLKFAIDFRIASELRDAAGEYRLCLGHGSSGNSVVEVLLGRESLRVRQGNACETVADITPGSWQHLELTLDFQMLTCRGSLRQKDRTQEWAGLELHRASRGIIDTISIDGRGEQTGVRPGLELDNLFVGQPAARSVDVRAVAATGPDSREPTAADDAQLETWKTELRTLFNTPPYPQGYAVWEGTPRDARLHQRGQPDQPGPRVPRQFIQLLGGHRLPPQAIGSGRLELADWLTAADSPLLARVFVNRIWQHHFGRGLVPTENDFGTRGQSPSHPELLDWLAAAFVESGWSVKAMHRRIMLSQVYQQGSAGSPAMRASDPSNIWLARFARRRLDAESIRDALLAVSGRLDDRMGGPHPFPEYLQTRYTQHGPFRGEYQTDRRSVYLMTRRLKQHSFLALFDGADTNASTARRATSTVATQALFMMNDPMVHELSEAIAAALIARHDAAAARIRDAFERTLARPPREIEQAEARALLEAYRAQLPSDLSEEERTIKIWAALARTLFARNEFIHID